MGGAKPRDLGDGSPPVGSRGGAPVGGLGTKRSWRISKVVKANFTHFLVVFHTFPPIYAYFSMLAGIIPQVCEMGAFDTVCPPCLQVRGATAPLAPPPMVSFILQSFSCCLQVWNINGIKTMLDVQSFRPMFWFDCQWQIHSCTFHVLYYYHYLDVNFWILRNLCGNFCHFCHDFLLSLTVFWK